VRAGIDSGVTQVGHLPFGATADVVRPPGELREEGRSVLRREAFQYVSPDRMLRHGARSRRSLADELRDYIEDHVPRERVEMRESAGIRRDAPHRKSGMPDERVDDRESVTRLLKEKRNEIEHQSEEPDTRSRSGASGPQQRALETERGRGCRGRRLPT
jgi:hypothetical protein